MTTTPDPTAGVSLDRYAKRVSVALDGAAGRAAQGQDSRRLRFEVTRDRWILVSDLHRGARNGADDFRRCERAYNAAMAFYETAGYTLLELGDVEELWEETARAVIRSYRHSLQLSARFHWDGRYHRVWGNHDDAWSFRDKVERHLGPVYDERIEVPESLSVEVTEEGTTIGRMLLIHGHQGSVMSDRWSRISRVPVRFLWRPVQRLFNVSLNTPATDWALREKHDIALYGWAARQQGLLLITGHTHRPVFRSESLATRLAGHEGEIRRGLSERPADPSLVRALAEVRAELEWTRAQDGSVTGQEGSRGRVVEMETPCYFNTGCCCFLDGDITGLELADGEIRLVRWPDDEARPRPQYLARSSLSTVFGEIAAAGAGEEDRAAALPAR